jgi:Mrr N-terminal domain
MVHGRYRSPRCRLPPDLLFPATWHAYTHDRGGTSVSILPLACSQAVIALGGSASIAELDAAVIERADISPEVQGVLHRDGPMTEVQYRLAWARTYLKGMGLLTNSQRGVWSVTENGQTVSEDEIPKLRAEYLGVLPQVGSEEEQAEGITVPLRQRD